MADETDITRFDAFLAQLDAVSEPDAVLQIRDVSQREIGMRIVPWEVPAITRNGAEVVMRGAFEGVDPSKVVLRMDHQNPPAGRGISYEDKPDGAYMVFKVSKTQRGDDILTLAQDGVATGASVGFEDVPGGFETYSRGGKLLRVVHRGNLREVSTTWNPVFKEAGIQYIRSAPEGEPAMPEAPVTPEVPETPAPVVDMSPVVAAIEASGNAQAASMAAFGERIAAIEERARMDFTIPATEDVNPRAQRGEWVQTVLRMLSGERVADIQTRALAELITTDNVGVVPPAYLTELIGVIDPARPFLNSTRHLDLPAAGMSLVVPKIVTRPTTGIQAAEKDPIVSTTTSITNVTFDAVTIAGGGDISLQLLKRSSPSYLSLYLELLAEAYGHNAELKALQVLLASSPSVGGALDPEDANFGAAWVNGAAVRKTPDTIWLSSEGVAKFIDAKATTTNMPLYSTIQAGFTAGSGPSGTISGLRPVYVPELDTASATVDAIVGPSSGFGWTEDGTYTLQVDVPALAGRDVAIAGILWFAPMYPTAFTTYTIAS